MLEEEKNLRTALKNARDNVIDVCRRAPQKALSYREKAHWARQELQKFLHKKKK